MKLNKLFAFVLLLTAAFAFQSCLKEDEDLFDKPSSQRVQEAMQKAQDMLMSSEKGWILELFPEATQMYGGYSYTVRFDKEFVYVHGERAKSGDTEIKSTYKMTNDYGPVLSFDGYNELIHEFATPSQSAYQALKGEFEFVVMKVEQDLITIRGKRTGNTMYLRRMTGDAASYINKVKALDDRIIMEGAKGSCGSATLSLTFDLDNRQIEWVDSENTKQSLAFALTDNGLRLYAPMAYGGKTMQNFQIVFDEARDVADYLQCTDEGATDVKLKVSLPEGWCPYADFLGKFTMTVIASSSKLDETIDVPVTLEADSDGSTIWIKGIAPKWDLKAVYNRSKGAMSISGQCLYELDHKTYAKPAISGANYYLGLLNFDLEKGNTSGSISYTQGTIGLTTRLDESTEVPSYKLVDNGLWSGHKARCFRIYCFTSTSFSSTTRNTSVSVPKDYYFTTGSYMLYWPERLTKVVE